MRADRLVAILLMLQARGQVTAAEVAFELEISERTARRDLDALAVAGLPIYSRQGRNGGWQLLGGGTTDLSGLNAAEARALFLVAGPSSATPQVKAALRKLVRALPEPFRSDAEAASSAVVVDPTAWGRSAVERPTPPYLEALQQAVIEGQQVVLDYVAGNRQSSTRVVHPLGLAAKGLAWYLVAGTEAGLRTFRVDRVAGVVGTGHPVERPEGFDLAEAWRLVTDQFDQQWAIARARGLADPAMVHVLRQIFGNRLRIGPTSADGRVAIEAVAPSLRVLAGELAGLGSSVEVQEPDELRELLATIGAELVSSYGASASD
jgi:predicted DNA-binding transcriptional regulator YafY